MQINIIAACDRNGLIGVNNRLPFAIQEDLKRFRELTLDHAVIMGRVTWESLPVKPLPERRNIYLTSKCDPNICVFVIQGGKKHRYTSSLNDAFNVCHSFEDDKAFIIGGERLYTEAMPLADRVYLTLVDTEAEVGPEDTVARFPLEQMQSLFRMESEDKRDGFSFTEWVRK
jgi:dihydrofolate reductase